MESPLTIVFVLGCPGAGKGTLCKRIANEMEWCHISVGDHLRYLSTIAIPGEDMFGGVSLLELQRYLQDRKLLPADTITAIIAHKIRLERGHGNGHFLIDGFPRTVEVAESFEREVAKANMVLMLECSKEVAKARFVNRKRGDDDAAVFGQRRGKTA
ncbi:hypothetical protein LTR08_002778 [Meristemomyces frigidus]|nr:hypothetical protein LTR08_002778 [Meristemomyces frigidus]